MASKTLPLINVCVKKVLKILFTTLWYVHCPFYANHRLVLKSEIEKILHENEIKDFIFSVDLFLYGHPSLESRENKCELLWTCDKLQWTYHNSVKFKGELAT